MHSSQPPLKLKVVCFGAGYVGGPTMAVMASKCPEHEFVVVDINAQLIERWNTGDYPIYEIGLPQLIQETLDRNLTFSVDIEASLSNADLIFIAVNTPTKQQGLGSGQAMDIAHFETCIRTIAHHYNATSMLKSVVIVEKSTVPARTSQFMLRVLQDLQTTWPCNAEKFTIISNPEFLSEGNAIADLLNPDRVIIGGTSTQTPAIKLLKDVYLRWVPEHKILTTNIFSSELCKLVANSFLAQRISSINSITALCEQLGADVDEVKQCIGADSRIGPKYLNPSIGFGGSCLGKDLLSLIYLAETLDLDEVATYWRQVHILNEHQKHRFAKKIIVSMFNNLTNKVISVFGVAFKANTNDVRESAAIDVICHLLEERAIIRIYDPQVKLKDVVHEMKRRGRYSPDHNITESESAPHCVEGSHAIVLLTEWDEFKGYDYATFLEAMKRPAYVFDGRNLLDPVRMRSMGFIYYCLGK